MYKIQSLIEHIEKVYGMEQVPCSIPRSPFQYFKRSFYIFIHNKISKKLFFFLRDKVSPIKYLDERPKGEIWFRKKENYEKDEFEEDLDNEDLEELQRNKFNELYFIDNGNEELENFGKSKIEKIAQEKREKYTEKIKHLRSERRS